MANFVHGINREVRTSIPDMSDAIKDQPHDYESIVPLELIREHTKTDDVLSVSDAQLKLYRAAAIQDAERITKLLISKRRSVVENVKLPMPHRERDALFGHEPHPYFYHDLEFSAGDSIGYYYGSHAVRPVEVQMDVGSFRVKLPRTFENFGLGCCTPCDGTSPARLQYMAGFSCAEEMPAAIALGVLKYVAHLIENPGDNVVVSTTSGGTQGTGLNIDAAANPSVASGALEIWRTIQKEAI